MKKRQRWLKVSKQQNCLNKISETEKQHHPLQADELVTDGGFSLVFSKLKKNKKQRNLFWVLSLNIIGT